jgi:hypothetical protein
MSDPDLTCAHGERMGECPFVACPHHGEPAEHSLGVLALLAREYLIAVRGLHVTHGSTDVHERGGFAGQALTPHCAWQCNVVVPNPDGRPPYQRIHAEALSRYEAAEIALARALSPEESGRPGGGIVPPFILDRIKGHEDDHQ